MRKRLKKKLGLNMRCIYCGALLTANNYRTHVPYIKDRLWWKKESARPKDELYCDDCIPF